MHRVFRAVATTIVPEAARWADLERIVERALAHRPAAMRRQLGVVAEGVLAAAAELLGSRAQAAHA